jgi:hypothetical protein
MRITAAAIHGCDIKIRENEMIRPPTIHKAVG